MTYSIIRCSSITPSQRRNISTPPLTYLFFLFILSTHFQYNEGCFIPVSVIQQPLSSYFKHSSSPSSSLRLAAAMQRSNQRNNNHHHHRPGRNRRSKHQKMPPMEYETSLNERGYNYIIGSDEVGRGSIAGPVLAVSCCILHHKENNEDSELKLIDFVTDSKELTEQQRQRIYNQIHNNQDHPYSYRYAIAQRSPQDIQNTNILKATMECFQESIQTLIQNENLPLNQSYAVVDGKSTPKLVNGPTPIPCRPYVNADKDIYTVSIASILAKVIRDEIMVDASKLYPEYGFDENKGYSTKSHIEAIHRYGPCPLHRMSFKPLQNR